MKSPIRWLAPIATLFALTACGPQEPASSGGPVTIHRLSEAQYRNAIADIFGNQIVVASRFDPVERTDGLLALGNGRATMTATAIERYHALAKSIAAQVVDLDNRGTLVPCIPATVNTSDDTCARIYFSRVGRLLYRRPLKQEEIVDSVKIAGAAAAIRGDFYTGLAYGLQGMLESLDFLFIRETAITDGKPGEMKLDAFSKASRLSFLLWNSTPDDLLLTDAEQGVLATSAGLARAVDRMMSSPRFRNGTRAFFDDMLSLDDFATLEKDSAIYPAFSLAAANDAKEQTLRTLVDLLISKNGDYRDLFTTRSTFMTSALGIVYRVPAIAPGGWTRYEFAENDPRAGIQTQLSFVALHSHPGKSSPTLRGKALRELLLCQKIPAPPGNVNFDAFNDPNSPNKTARQRLATHAVDPACAGCHKLMDPVGLALEGFDSAGQVRATENGAVIDTAGEIDGAHFIDGVSLGRVLHDDPAVTSCVVNRFAAYALGRPLVNGEKSWVGYLEKTFGADDYRFPALVRRIVLSESFYAVASAPSGSPSQSAGDGVEEPKS